MAQSQSQHVPVMLQEVVELLAPCPGQIIVDGTLGGGGHALALAQAVGPAGFVIALDRDARAIEAAERNLSGRPVKLVQANYADLAEVLREIAVDGVQGILLDLGMSSDQLADASRGFSFDLEGPLDLRFDVELGRPAWKLLQDLPEKELADLIYRFGEERFSRRIARRIVERRTSAPIQTASELAQLVRGAVPRSPRGGGIDPATRTFQALRIAVNDELGSLGRLLSQAGELLAPGGRIAVISFHSLEDRMVKHAFRSDEQLEVLTKKPLRPTAAEVARNPRSRSAKLRGAQRK